jgi:GntR family transcriptional regulator
VVVAPIDKTSYVPYYKQLAEVLRKEIDVQQARGEMYQLPSENELAERHGLSRATVRHALDELARNGWIYTQKGVGSFAPARRIEQDLTALVSTTEDMRQRGWNLVTQVLGLRCGEASEAAAAALDLPAEAPVFELRRLRIVDDVPLSLQTTYLPAALCPTLEQDDLTGSLYRLLESRYGLRLWTARETLRARSATDPEAAALAIPPASPVMYAERTTYAADGQAVEYLEAVWRGDRYDFKVTLTRPQS